MKFTTTLASSALVDAICNRGKTAVFFCDQDRTVSVPLSKTRHQRILKIHDDVVGIVKVFERKGGVYIPSSARSIGQLRQAYGDYPLAAMSGNDGFIIQPPNGEDLIYYSDERPDFSKLRQEVPTFLKGKADTDYQEMDVYFQMLIDRDHPDRPKASEFFKEKQLEVEAISECKMVIRDDPDSLSMEPYSNRGKGGVIQTMLPMLGVKDPYIIVAGDGANDIPALKYAKSLGQAEATAIWVNKDGETECPEFADIAVNGVEEMVALFRELVAYMK